MKKTTLFFSIALLVILLSLVSLVSCAQFSSLLEEPLIEEPLIEEPLIEEPLTEEEIKEEEEKEEEEEEEEALVPSEIVMIEGREVAFKIGSTTFYADASTSRRIESGELLSNQIIIVDAKEVAFKEGEITFHTRSPIGTVKTGVVETGVLASNQTLMAGRVGEGGREIEFKGGSEINFYRSGEIESGVMGSRISLQVKAEYVYFYENTEVTFHISGGIKKGTNGETPLGSIEMAGNQVQPTGGTEITFHENGSLASLDLFSHHNFRVGTMMVHFRGVKLSFYINEEIKSGTLHTDSTIGGVMYLAGTVLNFSRQGVLQR